MKKEGGRKGDHQKLKENLWVAMGLSILFGLGWAIGLLASTGLPSYIQTLFEWIFTVMTAFQGIIIFILYCLRAAEARKVWKRILCCERQRLRRIHSTEPSSSGWFGTLAAKLTSMRVYSSETHAQSFSVKQKSTTDELNGENRIEISTAPSGEILSTNPIHLESEFTSKDDIQLQSNEGTYIYRYSNFKDS